MDSEAIFRSGEAGKSSRSGAYGMIFRRSMGGKETGGRVWRDPNRLLGPLGAWWPTTQCWLAEHLVLS